MGGVLGELRRLLRPIETRVTNLVSRGVVARVDDGTKLQTLQVTVGEDETRDGLERFQQYGLTSVPEPEAEVVVLFVGGRRDAGYVVAVDDRRYRVTGLAPGEVALYDSAGSRLVLKSNGDVEITPASGVVKVAGDVQADGISLKSHVHSGSTLTTTATVGASAVPGVISGNTGTPT